MTLNTWLAFFVASWLISLSPGPAAFKSMSTGMRGYRQGFWNIVGLQLGLILMVAVIAAGLGAALAASPPIFAAIKWFGVAYLIWLGIQQWRTEPVPVRLDAENEDRSRRLMIEGFLVNVSNPKGIVFLLAVMPQFIDSRTAQLPQYAICLATMLFTDTLVMSGYTVLARQIALSLRAPSHVRWLNRAFGGLFIGAGALMAAYRHGA